MNQEKIGKFISECRKSKKLTQSEIAEKLGVSNKAVSKWENGKCMPDLSLFIPLCEILEITVNDLMSGEKIDNKEYINALGENIVNMVSNLEIKKKRKNRLIFLLLISIFILFIICRIFYINYEIDVKYDSRVMTCNINDKELKFIVKGQSVWNIYYTIRKINNEEIYFFHSTINIYNKKRSHWEYSESLARLLEGNEIPFGSGYNLNVINKNIKVYYTDSSIKKVKKADKEQLDDIIKNSYLMCERNNN